MSSNLIAFVKDISRADPIDLPLKFLQLERFLSRSSSTTGLKYDIISYEILPLLLLSLRQDFNKVDDGWNLAAMNLTPMASACLCLPIERNDPRLREQAGLFLDKYLPQGIESFIFLAKNIQEQYSAEKQTYARKSLLGCFDSVLKNLIDVLSAHHSRETLFKQVLTSIKFMELYLTDDNRFCSVMIQCLRDVLDQSRNGRAVHVFANLTRKLKEDYVNELVYKLFVFDNSDIGREATRTLLIMCELDQSIPSMLSQNFKGLQTVLQRYTIEEIGPQLRDLLRILRGGKVAKTYATQIKTEEAAALKIQKVWRGYFERKRLSKAQEGIRKFQSKFRKRKQREEREREFQRERAELQYQAVLKHIRRLREFKIQQIRAIEILPASQVEKYLEVQSVESAIKIQAFFRGYLQRKRMKSGFYDRLIAEKAARRIQRVYRQYRQRKKEDLDRRLKRLEYIKPQILTETKREQIIEQIETWKRERAPRALSDKDFEDLYEQGQDRVQDYVRTNRAWRRVEQRQRALLHMMENDSDFLMSNYTKLKSIMKPDSTDGPIPIDLNDVARFLTHPSSAVRYRARQDHLEALKFVRSPWYKSLQVADMDEDDIDALDDNDLKNMGLLESRRDDILSNPTRYEYEKRKFYIFEPLPASSSALNPF